LYGTDGGSVVYVVYMSSREAADRPPFVARWAPLVPNLGEHEQADLCSVARLTNNPGWGRSQSLAQLMLPQGGKDELTKMGQGEAR
jgi:hypothetical protein